MRTNLTVERLNDTAANRRDDVLLKLEHIQGTLDLLRIVSLSHDCDADLNALCAVTLVNVLDGLMREVAAVQEHIDGLPGNAESLLLEAIRALNQSGDPTYIPVLRALEQAHEKLDVLDHGRAGRQLTEEGAQS